MSRERSDSLHRLPEELFDSLTETTVRDAILRAFSGSLLAQQTHQIELIIGAIEQYFRVYGRFLGAENVGETTFSSSIVRLTYLTRFERAPVKWEFYMYWSDEGWIIISFDLADDVKSWL